MKFPIDRELQTKLLLLYKIGCNNFRDFFAAKKGINLRFNELLPNLQNKYIVSWFSLCFSTFIQLSVLVKGKLCCFNETLRRTDILQFCKK